MEMRLAEYEGKIIHLMNDKIESEVGEVKEITESNSLKTNDIAERITKMERFMFLANQETKQKSKKNYLNLIKCIILQEPINQSNHINYNKNMK